MISDQEGELCFHVNGVCYGSEVIYGDLIQINAYILGTEFDENDVIEFVYHEYNSRNEDKRIGEYLVQDQATKVYQAKALDLSTLPPLSQRGAGGFYSVCNTPLLYHVSLKDKSEYEIPVPEKTALLGNYPNPFNPETTIRYQVSGNRDQIAGDRQQETHVSIIVYNVKGQKVRSLVNEPMITGNHEIVWNGRDDQGRQVGSGIYLYRMRAEDFVETRRMILLK